MNKTGIHAAVAAGVVLAAGMVAFGCATGAKVAAGAPDAALSGIDMTKWQYNAGDGVYYQLGVQYVAQPADTAYETLGIFVPAEYLTATKNADGSYTAAVNKRGSVAGHTARTAPYVIPVETPGYAALKAPTEYIAGVADYTRAGFIFVFAGCRGRDQGAPLGITDLKAAIRYVRHNRALLPGDTERFFSFGMSGGGAQSALLGATGNSPLYEPYLAAIGAVTDESDAVAGSMCWCPITNLDVADEAYEWNMGQSRTGLDDFGRDLSDRLAAAYADYVNGAGFAADGKPLALEAGGDGVYQAGSYYDYIKALVEASLNDWLSATLFPYNASAPEPHAPMLTPGFVLRGPGAADAKPAAGFESRDNVRRTAAASGVTLSGVYATAQDYIDALNADGDWVRYDAATNAASITSLAAFSRAVKPATKSVGAFDDLAATQGENTLFGYGDGAGRHFDPVLASLLAGTEYEAAFAADLARTDALGTSVATRADMYNPMYFVHQSYGGYQSADVAPFWRIRSGIFQGDTAVCTEANLALALKNYGARVDFAAVWGLHHVEAETGGTAVQNFIAWVNDCTR